MKRLGTADRAMVVCIYVFLVLLSFSALYPFWNTLVVSLNEGMDTAKGGVTFWPRAFTWTNYDIVFGDKNLLNAFWISISRTVVGTVSATLVTALLAYGMTKSYLMGRKFYTFFFVFTMYFGGGLIPTFLLIKSLGLMNNFLVFIIPALVSVWNMIVFRTFFKGLPAGLEESAQIDGCSNWGIFAKIILPLSGPVIATLGLFTAVAHWNDWFLPTIYIFDQQLMPVQSLLRRLLNANLISEQMGIDSNTVERMSKKSITSKSLVNATIMVVTLPIIAVYPFVQKYFVKGVMVGSMKE
ncbi:carbohydrate ABC transporter permease [Paenibacillus sp. PAMC21692]|uniref:carbohydrate ABC transporter permease n=1 Tax=Paenibacillus sp. PAMC21692 TaxID=2762320 RepID=UPI00164EC450|nr:carbohydrate ABC transporter permease [Paenibacillus sp. PAMC21692]QNK60830.1 carbohydrate ABC transporter permease [Paenibacillus sp. PAMC21692]